MAKRAASVAKDGFIIVALLAFMYVMAMPATGQAQQTAPISLRASPEDSAVTLPPLSVTPSDPFTDPAYYSRVLKRLPCLGTCDQQIAEQPSGLVRALLWMLYPTVPPEPTEADRVRMQVKRDNQRADKLP